MIRLQIPPTLTILRPKTNTSSNILDECWVQPELEEWCASQCAIHSFSYAVTVRDTGFRLGMVVDFDDENTALQFKLRWL
jgi:hypothetical protein